MFNITLVSLGLSRKDLLGAAVRTERTSRGYAVSVSGHLF
jgi:hypothetical protein